MFCLEVYQFYFYFQKETDTGFTDFLFCFPIFNFTDICSDVYYVPSLLVVALAFFF